MDQQTRELVVCRLRWNLGLLKLVGTSRGWYDAVHGRECCDGIDDSCDWECGGRGGVPVQETAKYIRWRAGYLRPWPTIRVDGWSTMQSTGRGDLQISLWVIAKIIQSYGRPLPCGDMVPYAGYLKPIMEQVVQWTSGIREVEIKDPSQVRDEDLRLFRKCGVETVVLAADRQFKSRVGEHAMALDYR